MSAAVEIFAVFLFVFGHWTILFLYFRGVVGGRLEPQRSQVLFMLSNRTESEETR